MKARSLDRVGMNVRSLEASIGFYEAALGFSASAIGPGDAALLGVHAVRRAVLRRGRQSVELTECSPPGAAYPQDSGSNDLWFQHCALATGDIAASYARLRSAAFTPISADGPQALPGGITAFKFRDPDGHPLELIQFPDGKPLTAEGIDHSAIAVSDVARSVAFYMVELGLAERARQVNTGPAQDALDGLAAVTVDVVALAPAVAAPHVELLGYRAPRGRAAPMARLSGIAASRLVFKVDGRVEARILRDPDGHICVME